MKTREQVEELKRQWAQDPCWSLSSISGFEEYRDELRAFESECFNVWKKDKEKGSAA